MAENFAERILIEITCWPCWKAGFKKKFHKFAVNTGKNIKKRVLVTGASGFIGSSVVDHLKGKFSVICLDRNQSREAENGKHLITGDITDQDFLRSVFNKYRPDVVVHSAGIAHENMARCKDPSIYDLVNHQATINLARAASDSNPNVHFIFFSSISVYGENNGGKLIGEETSCSPTTVYAQSKLNAEKDLYKMFQKGQIQKVDILRLSPVYDCMWCHNLEKRVLDPKRLFFLKFGSGEQRLSILSRQNLSGFVKFVIENRKSEKFCNLMNVADQKASSFNQILGVFKKYGQYPGRLTIRVPLSFVWISTRIAGAVLRRNSKWIHSCYDKVANSLIFDNKRMLDTGFVPEHDLETVFGKK